MELLLRITAGLGLGAAISATAFRVRALTRSGAAAAALTGGLIFGLGGLPWAALLLVFFITSSGLSHLFKRTKHALQDSYAKGSQRDWSQVLANGGIGVLLVLLHAVYPSEAWLWSAYAGTMAAVNADTWATELGVLNPGKPRLISNLRTVQIGTSGAISPVGTLAALAGALIIGIPAALIGGYTGAAEPLRFTALVGLAGLTGSMVDSFLGATLQVIYWCPTCEKESERHPVHGCGTPTSFKRGLSWMNNDLVNFICSLAGAVAAGLLMNWVT